MRSIGLFSIAVLFFWAAPQAAEIPAAVRDNVTRRVDAGDAVGIVIAVVDGKNTAFFDHGSCDGDGAPLLESTLFEIGSITKVFTALVLADMVNDGLLALDDPISRFLPPGIPVPERNGREITLASLARHRSGLPRLPDNLAPADPANPYADYDEARLLAFLAGHTLARDVGQTFEYSNLGMGLLGYLLSRQAGLSYEELVRRRVLEPLHMESTGIVLTDGLRARLAVGHDRGKPVENWDLDALAGAGALRSTAADLVRFLRAASGLDATPLADDFAMMLREPQETGSPGQALGLGWFVESRGGARIVWHGGGTGGYRSFVGFRPDTKRGVVVLTNSTENIDDVGFHLLNASLPLEEPKVALRLPPQRLDEYTGYYELAPGSVFHITREGEQLMAQLTGQPQVPVFANSDSTFYYKVVDARLEFRRDATGRVLGLILYQNGIHQAKRIENYTPPRHEEITLPREVLQSYVGRYELQPGQIFVIQLDGDQLMAQLTGQPAFPVYPESETRFFYKVVEAQLLFHRDASGTVTGLELHQSGMTLQAKKIE